MSEAFGRAERLPFANRFPHSAVLAKELASVRAAQAKSGRTDWAERGGEHVLLPAQAVATFFVEISVNAGGGALIPVAY